MGDNRDQAPAPVGDKPGPTPKCRDTIMPWEDVQDVIAKGELHRLLRLTDTWYRYIARCDEIEAQYETLGDYILESVFKFQTAVSPSGKKKSIVPELKEPMVVFAPNDFPYAFEPDVSHDLLWTTGELTEQFINENIERLKPAESYEVLYFVNTPALRSIHNVSHAHIISRPRKAQQPSS